MNDPKEQGEREEELPRNAGERGISATTLSAYRSADDETLVLAALVGELNAFDELCRRYRTAVILTAQQAVGSRAVAEEIAQDVFLVAFQSLPNLEDPSRFGAWLRAIARFRSQRVATREWRVQATETTRLETLREQNADASEQEIRESSDPADAWQRQVERDALWEALTRLSEEHREVLLLHYGEEWSLARIAAFLSVPESTIKGRLFRAREAMRRCFVPEEERIVSVTSTPKTKAII